MQTGFSIEAPLPSKPAHVSARDFFIVDEYRNIENRIEILPYIKMPVLRFSPESMSPDDGFRFWNREEQQAGRSS